MPRHNGNTTKRSKRQARIDRINGHDYDPEAWERSMRYLKDEYPEWYAAEWTSETASMED